MLWYAVGISAFAFIPEIIDLRFNSSSFVEGWEIASIPLILAMSWLSIFSVFSAIICRDRRFLWRAVLSFATTVGTVCLILWMRNNVELMKLR